MPAVLNSVPRLQLLGPELEFTKEQLRAIDIQRLGEDACIVAGPGSGKTTVLVERYRQLIASGIKPSEILAITFTEKAAANMRRRLTEAFADSPELLSELDRAYVSTIHGFCSRLLRDNATSAGVDPEFTVLDEQVAVLEQARALRETLDRFVAEERESMNRLLDVTGGADLEGLIPGVYDGLRAAGLRPAQLRELPTPKVPKLELILAAAKRYVDGFPLRPNPKQQESKHDAQQWIVEVESARSASDLAPLLCGMSASFNLRTTNAAKEEIKGIKPDVERYASWLLDQVYAPEEELLICIFESFDDLYRSRKFAAATLDFNDLEFYAVRLLEEHPEIRQSINDQFRLVMIDEFQDTSAQQSRLVELIRAPGRFYAVGDLNQSIYSFRHASPRVFEDYRTSVDAVNGHLQELVENWRSREPILLATQLLLHEAKGITTRDLVPARKLPARDHPCVEVIVCERDPENDEDAYALEAAWVVDRIVHLRQSLRLKESGRNAKLSDFVILVRNSNILDPYLDALERANLDYNLNRRSGFFETREARDLLHLLRAIYNPRDEVSLLVTLRSDFAGLSDEGLLRLRMARDSSKNPLLEADLSAFSEGDRTILTRFRTAFSRWRSAASQVPIDRLVLRALDDMGVGWNAASSRGENIEKFLAIARSYPDMTLGEFIDHAMAMRTANPRESDAPIDETRDAIQIMTTHAAKGLEFPVVILTALDKGVDSGRGSPILNFTPDFGLGVKWSWAGKKNESGLVHLENKTRINGTEAEESNRLLYVALTRAEEHLILSWTEAAGKAPGNWAGAISAALGLAETPPAESAEIRTYSAPNERTFDMRMFRTAALPPPFVAEDVTSAGSEALVLERPLLTEQFDPGTTASSLAQFAHCPRKYYLARFLGWDGRQVRPRIEHAKSDTGPRASDVGTQVHQLLAGSQPDAPDLQAVALARVFERSALGKRSYKARNRETEWDFVFAFEDLILRGTVDLWFEDGSGLTLVDYKTDAVTPEGTAERAREYALQLQVYALALEKAFGRMPQRAWLHFLRPEIAVEVPLADAKADVSRTAREFLQAQVQVNFPLHVGPHCRRCEFYRNLCPAKLNSVEYPVQ